MKSADIEKIVKVIARTMPPHCKCWKCDAAREAIDLVEGARRAPRKRKTNVKETT
jgi:hypothetical protein